MTPEGEADRLLEGSAMTEVARQTAGFESNLLDGMKKMGAAMARARRPPRVDRLHFES
jgi:hypothetical protein